MATDTPTERILRLAAYAHERTAHHEAITLGSITADVPGYETDAPRNDDDQLVVGGEEWERVRKLVRRDLTILSDQWGIELEPDGDGGYRLHPPCFTPGERRAVLAAAAAVAVEGMEAAVPGALGTAVDDADAQIVIRVHALVRVLRDAIGNARAVAFTYDGEARVVEPYALGTWRNRWYLAGYDRTRAGPRRFRLDRVDTSTTPPITAVGDVGGCAMPDDFDAEAAFDLDPNSWGTDPCVQARVWVGHDHVDAFLAEFASSTVLASETRRSTGKLTPKRGGGGGGEGGEVVGLEVREHSSFRTRLLAFRGHAVVLEPPELVAVVRDHLRALAATA